MTREEIIRRLSMLTVEHAQNTAAPETGRKELKTTSETERVDDDFRTSRHPPASFIDENVETLKTGTSSN